MDQVLPKDMQPTVRRELIADLLLGIREWRSDQRFIPKIEAPKKLAKRDGLPKLSDRAKRALTKIRRELRLSTTFYAAVDAAVVKQRKHHATYSIRRAMKKAFPEAHDEAPPGNPYAAKIVNPKTGLPVVLDEQPAETLDLALSHAIAGIREWDSLFRNERKRPRSEATRLAEELYDIAQSAGLSQKNIEDLIDALSHSAGLPSLCGRSAQKRKERERSRPSAPTK